jgi:menaquinone-dependent protoporphyrinogen IX oxidase
MNKLLVIYGTTDGHTKKIAQAIVRTAISQGCSVDLFLKRWIMKRIAQKAGGGTDTSKDYEYTDWQALDKFARDFIQQHRLVSVPA